MDAIAVNDTTNQTKPLSSIDDHLGKPPIDHLDQDANLAKRLAQEEEELNSACTNDVTLAVLLQKQFDHEHDHYLGRVEAKINGNSKVGVSLDRFKRASHSSSAKTTKAEARDGSDDDEFYDLTNDKSVDPDRAWDVFEQYELNQRSHMMGRSGFVSDPQGNIITKHDIPTTSRRNMCRLMELRTDIQTGDAGASKDDFKIANHVYNKLRIHSKKASRRESQRLFEKKIQEKKSGAQKEDATAD